MQQDCTQSAVKNGTFVSRIRMELCLFRHERITFRAGAHETVRVVGNQKNTRRQSNNLSREGRGGPNLCETVVQAKVAVAVEKLVRDWRMNNANKNGSRLQFCRENDLFPADPQSTQ